MTGAGIVALVVAAIAFSLLALVSERMGADLRSATFSGVRMKGADLTGARCEESSLRDVDLSDASLHRANFTDCDLRGSDLSALTTDDTEVRGAIVTYRQAIVIAMSLGLDVRED